MHDKQTYWNIYIESIRESKLILIIYLMAISNSIDQHILVYTIYSIIKKALWHQLKSIYHEHNPDSSIPSKHHKNLTIRAFLCNRLRNSDNQHSSTARKIAQIRITQVSPKKNTEEVCLYASNSMTSLNATMQTKIMMKGSDQQMMKNKAHIVKQSSTTSLASITEILQSKQISFKLRWRIQICHKKWWHHKKLTFLIKKDSL